MTQQFKFGDRVQDTEGKQFIFLRSHLSCCTVASSDGGIYVYLLDKIHPCATEPHPDTVRAAQSKWISVEERLPEAHDDILVYTCDGDIYPILAICGDMTWIGISGATHWQPLPEPPETIGK